MADPVRIVDLDAMPTMDPKHRDGAIQEGHLMVGSGRYWISKWIQFFTRSPWSHVALLFKDRATGQVMVLEAVEDDGVRIVPLERYLLRYDGRGPYDGRLVLAKIERLDDRKVQKALEHGRSLLHRPFDNLEILRILGRIMIRRKRRVHRDAAYMCSELVQECLKEADLTIGIDLAGFTSPAAFWRHRSVTPIGRID